jgi:formylglycine-generating enzyme required for sulfatase activity
MKLFISYSREDKDWVSKFCPALRDEGQHDPWIDDRLLPAQDWWETILMNIEDCQCFIYILTPQSVESIYCQAELNYALALNKPVLPLMLKPCDYPAELNERRIQYEPISDDAPLHKILFRTEQALGEIRVGLVQGKYPATTAPRPALPEPTRSQQTLEVFIVAEEAAAEGNVELATKLFAQVSNVDRTWGKAARQRLNEMLFEIQRDQDYRALFEMQKNLKLIKGTRAAAHAFIEKYGKEYDPNHILPGLIQETTEMQLPAELRRQVEVVKAKPVELPPGTRMIDDKGVTMVYVPAGEFMMGEGEKQHEVEIARPFWFDLTPVTNESYAQFVKDKGYQKREFWTESGWAWMHKEMRTAPRDYDRFTHPSQPRVGVTWFEAYAYCRWRGGRLPTEAEWEWAARGPKKHIYPWGDIFVSDYVIWANNSGELTANVGEGIRSNGASWVGVLDMSGNVWEWCNSLSRPYPYKADDGRESKDNTSEPRVLRGGSWDNKNIQASYRINNYPSNQGNVIGFRCARSAE